MNSPANFRRLRARLAAAPGEPQRLSRWAWTADVILAVVLSASTVVADWQSVRFVPGPAGSGSAVKYLLVPDGVPPPQIPPVPPFGQGPGGARFFGMVAVSTPLWLLAVAALSGLPLALRRRFPLSAFWAVLATSLVYHLAERPVEGIDDTAFFTFVGCLIAAYSAAVYGRHRRLIVASMVAGALLLAIFHNRVIPTLTPGFVPFLLLVPIGLAANTVHAWRQRVRTLEAEREAATRLAVQRERARIARELHDVVTHNVSMMTVQAGAARKVMATAPALAEEALLAVEAGGRAAMSELRHVMGLLTMATGPEGPEAPELAPQPGLAQVDTLASRVRDTGVPVELAVSGAPAPLPPGVDLAAYRVVQEALTNTVKHASGARVRIAVDHRPGEVRIAVADSGGVRSAPAAGGAGRGLIGLRERLAVYGGTLDAGPGVSGGYRVTAVIPVEDG
ncbi:histidine kinase [Streptomyces sp. V4-01]|uniref:histidine kinase n=1 Tax=Actinacidiphila polyblastidii TaxID=3110430 RepID=A0ABU7PBA1_9ACTN|nr:histidine kinase [Streptomyces sp. V4-01]